MASTLMRWTMKSRPLVMLKRTWTVCIHSCWLIPLLVPHQSRGPQQQLRNPTLVRTPPGSWQSHSMLWWPICWEQRRQLCKSPPQRGSIGCKLVMRKNAQNGYLASERGPPPLARSWKQSLVRGTHIGSQWPVACSLKDPYHWHSPGCLPRGKTNPASLAWANQLMAAKLPVVWKMVRSFVQPTSKRNANLRVIAPMAGLRVTEHPHAANPLSLDGALRRRGQPPQGQISFQPCRPQCSYYQSFLVLWMEINPGGLGAGSLSRSFWPRAPAFSASTTQPGRLHSGGLWLFHQIQSQRNPSGLRWRTPSSEASAHWKLSRRLAEPLSLSSPAGWDWQPGLRFCSRGDW